MKLCFYSNHGSVPFTIDIVSILPDCQSTPTLAATDMINRFNWPFKTTVIANATFGSQSFVQLYIQKGLGVICSVNTGVQNPWLWKWMKWDLCKDEGRVLIKNNRVATLIFWDERMHYVYTTT